MIIAISKRHKAHSVVVRVKLMSKSFNKTAVSVADYSLIGYLIIKAFALVGLSWSHFSYRSALPTRRKNFNEQKMV